MLRKTYIYTIKFGKKKKSVGNAYLKKIHPFNCDARHESERGVMKTH